MKYFSLFFVLIFFFVCIQSKAQETKSFLQSQNKKLKNSIVQLNKELKENKKTKNNVIFEYKTLEKKINSRKKIILNINRTVKILDDEIYTNQININKLKREYSSLIKEYKKVLVKSYKNKSLQNKISFIISSQNLTHAIRRLKYLKKYSEYQNKHADEINSKKIEIELKNKENEKAKSEQILVLNEQKLESEELQVEIDEQQKLLVSVKAKEVEITAKILKNKIESKKLDKEIQRIIVEEIRIAKKKTEEERKKRLTEEKKRLLEIERNKKEDIQKSTKSKLEKKEALKVYNENIKKIENKIYDQNTKEVDLISSKFEANKGLLSWPVQKGEITGYFGVTNHPILNNITIENSGIDIGTNKGEDARAVFEGEVSAIYSIPGGSKAILIQHGEYFTVYNNLSVVYVKKGDTINLKKSIGKIYTDATSGLTTLNFQIWKGTTKLNPSSWIIK